MSKFTKFDLLLRPVGKSRHKAISTISKRKGISYEEARKLQASKILNEKR